MESTARDSPRGNPPTKPPHEPYLPASTPGTTTRRQAISFGDRCVETDWRLFCTLVRFDAVYHGHFKCNLRRIVDYPNLHRYLKDLYSTPGIANTVNFDHIKRHYYVTHDDINPTRIVPIGPILDL